jgi:hypothetical protein
MQSDDYPFPIHEVLEADATDEQAAAYEQSLVLLLTEWIQQQGGEAHGQSGMLLGVRLADSKPDTRLILHYRSHAGGEYDREMRFWGEQGITGAPQGDPPCYDGYASEASVIVANWADGSLRAPDDPYEAAIERRRRAR